MKSLTCETCNQPLEETEINPFAIVVGDFSKKCTPCRNEEFKKSEKKL